MAPVGKGRAAAQQAAADSYVDPALCAQCHAEIASSYRKTGMGRSFYRLPGVPAGELTTTKPFYHAASENYFAMIERGGKYYQRRWQIGFDGKETNIEETQVDFVLGPAITPEPICTSPAATLCSNCRSVGTRRKVAIGV